MVRIHRMFPSTLYILDSIGSTLYSTAICEMVDAGGAEKAMMTMRRTGVYSGWRARKPLRYSTPMAIAGKTTSIGVAKQPAQVKAPLSADRGITVGPDEQAERQLKRTAVKHHLRPQDHVDQGKDQIAYIAVYQRGFIHRIKPEGPAKEPCQKDPENTGSFTDRAISFQISVRR